MNDLSVSKLYELMIKKGIKPEYKLVRETGTDIKQFEMCVFCPLIPNGKIYSATGSDLSKKKAKHKAASAFIQKFLGNQNSNSSVVKQACTVCIVNIVSKNIITVLQVSVFSLYKEKRIFKIETNNFNYRLFVERIICGQPQYTEVSQKGPPHSPTFTLECKVNHLRTEGEGGSKSEAKLKVSKKMIQVLMEADNIYEIFESPQLNISENDDYIISLIDPLKISATGTPIGIFGKKKLNDKFHGIYNISGLFQIQLLKDSNISEVDKGTAKSLNHSKVPEISENLNGVFEQKVVISKEKSKLLNNSANCGVDNNKEPDSKSMCLKKILKIDKTLESVEKQIYDEIRSYLSNHNRVSKKTVAILCDNYEVLVDVNSHAKIYNGKNECTNRSVRIACLAQLLVDIKSWMEKIC